MIETISFGGLAMGVAAVMFWRIIRAEAVIRAERAKRGR